MALVFLLGAALGFAFAMGVIEDNEFTINQNNYFKRKRPDKTTLVVYDQSNAEVLHVRYLNRSAVRVTGVFRYGDRVVVIDDNSARIGMVTLSGSCTTNSLVMISN